MEWEAKDFLIDQNERQSRVFTFNLQLKGLPGNQARWYRMDGVVLSDGRVMLNREEYFRALYVEAGLEDAGLIEQLTRWVELHAQPVVTEAASGF